MPNLLDDLRTKSATDKRKKEQGDGAGFSLLDELRGKQSQKGEPSQLEQKKSMMARGHDLAKKRLQNKESHLASLSPEKRELLESTGAAESALIGMGKGFSDVGRGLGLMEQESDEDKEIFRELEANSPVAAGVGEVVGQALPFVPAGIGVAGIASTPLRVAATGTLGGTEGAVIAKGQGGNLGEQIFSAGIGAGVASALELGVPIIGRLGGKLVRRALGKSPKGAVVDKMGNPSQELLQALKSEGIEFSDLVDDAVKELKRSEVKPAQAARKAFLESQGLTGDAAPTRAQITRSVDDFAVQQEALKSSGRVEKRIAAQDKVLTTRFSDVIERTGGDPNLPTSSVSESLLQKATVLDDEISSLYTQAREIVGDEKVVRFDALSRKLKDLAPLNERSGGNVKAVFETLKQKGLIGKDMKPTGRLGVEETETQVRQLINSLYDSSKSGGDPVNSVLREMKDALDDDVFKGSGEDLFKAGRAAKAKFERDLARAKISKFDTRKKNLVRDILENKDSVAPDNFTKNVVFGKGWRDTDLQQLKDYITTEGHGQSAWNDLRADVLQNIKEKAFIGPQDANGFQSLSRDKIDKALGTIGLNKMKVLFSPEELSFLNNLKKVAEIREPRKMVQQGFGPSAKAVMYLDKKLQNLPVLGAVFGVLNVDSAGRLTVRSSAQSIPQKSAGSTIRTPLAIGAGAGATSVAAEPE